MSSGCARRRQPCGRELFGRDGAATMNFTGKPRVHGGGGIEEGKEKTMVGSAHNGEASVSEATR